ncbi:MAG: hypothetical protein ACSW8F_04805, partial [bacterium]
TGVPIYVNMKITRMPNDPEKIILGVSVVDSQMKEKERVDGIQMEKNTFARIIALNADYLGLYTIDPITGSYYEYNTSEDYGILGFEKSNENFFERGVLDGKSTVYPEDLPYYNQHFTREQILREIHENGVYRLVYRLMNDGQPRKVILRISPIKENGVEKLLAGVRAWRERK